MDAANDAADRKSRAMVARFLSQAGVDDPQLSGDAARLLQRQIAAIGEQGVRESDLAVMGQAYIRAVGRIVAAEAEAIHRVRDATRASDAQMRAMAQRFLPLGREVFDVLHSLLLARAVAEDEGRLDRSRRTRRPVAVAHVDVVASTAYLEQASLAETQRLVDGLFASAQSAIRGRGVEATKYVGDGVFLVGNAPEDVAAASLDCILSLAKTAGLRSRAGLAYGPVVHRAGDVFGLPVNLCHALTKSAEPGTMLATAVDPAALPAAMCEAPREVTVKGIETPVRAYELRMASPSPQS